MRVLAVDDEADIRLLLEVALGLDPSIALTLASSGAEALVLAAGAPFDVILLDGLMPAMDGAETCRRLKDDPDTRKVPVIFLTAIDARDARDALREAGAAGFIAKPFDPFALAGQLRDMLAELNDMP